jgi:hypothetical protein
MRPARTARILSGMDKLDLSDADRSQVSEVGANENRSYAVGYCRPPLHARFKPGQSGNPSGRRKGSENFKTLFHKILNEQIPLIDGDRSRKVSKGEAIMRRLVIGALKGDSRSLLALFRLAEQTGQFEDERDQFGTITRIIVDTGVPRSEAFGASSEVNTEIP